MWFKKASVYLLNVNALPLQADIETGLSDAPFTNCQGLDWYSEGFASPVSFEESLVFASKGSLRIALQKEEKVLPSGVIKNVLDKKILEIEQAENRQIGRKEKQALKEQITDDLLPKAFTRLLKTQAIIDTNRGFFIVNNASPTKAEAMLSKVRQALGGLNAKLIRTQMSPSSLMTDWLLSGECSGNFELDSTAVMKGTGDSAPMIRASKQNLGTDEIKNHLTSGKTVTELGLVWKDQISFVLDSNFTFKGIQYLDVIQDEASQDGDDMQSLFVSSQLIMTESLGEMFTELIELLGGVDQG